MIEESYTFNLIFILRLRRIESKQTRKIMKKIWQDYMAEIRKLCGFWLWNDKLDTIYWEQDGIYCIINRINSRDLCRHIAFLDSYFHNFNF